MDGCSFSGLIILTDDVRPQRVLFARYFVLINESMEDFIKGWFSLATESESES